VTIKHIIGWVLFFMAQAWSVIVASKWASAVGREKDYRLGVLLKTLLALVPVSLIIAGLIQ
jgi:hypothetical protein